MTLVTGFRQTYKHCSGKPSEPKAVTQRHATSMSDQHPWTFWTEGDSKVKGKGPVLDIALLHNEHMLRSASQSCKWQLIGMS